MTKNDTLIIETKGTNLFDRVVSILEQARANVVKAVNSNMVIAYWLIGREIVNEVQQGIDRAEYGKQVIENLSDKLTNKYGRGFSTTNIRYFRKFYTVFSGRSPAIRHIECGELDENEKCHNQSGVLNDMSFAVERKDSDLKF